MYRQILYRNKRNLYRTSLQGICFRGVVRMDDRYRAAVNRIIPIKVVELNRIFMSRSYFRSIATQGRIACWLIRYVKIPKLWQLFPRRGIGRLLPKMQLQYRRRFTRAVILYLDLVISGTVKRDLFNTTTVR